MNMVIFIPRNIQEKQLICLAGQNFGCHKIYHFKAASIANNIELLMLDLDFMVNVG